TLYYNDTYAGNTPRYNGNISAMSWSVSGENKTRGYNFTYDNLSRLTGAGYLENGNANLVTEFLYDKNGNLIKDYNKSITEISYNVLNLPQTLKISSATNTYTYAADGRKLKTVLGGSIVQSNHYYPFGMSFAEGSTTSQQPYKYNGKELDTERGLNLYDYSARYMDPALGRFSTVDPHAEKYYSWSPYAYCYNNPLKFIDPDGKDGVFIAFPDYKISTPLGKVGGLGHAGVLLIDNKTGYTKYYEYGRYDSENKGEVRTKSVSNVLIGKDGKPTEESLNKVLGQISDKAGQKGKIEGAYVKSDKFDKMKDYADSKMTENKDPDRKEYTLTGNNCGTFAADVLKQDPDVKDKAPITIIARPNGMVKDWQSNFEKITYDPDKKKENK
ncbi:MAG: RHS repeat-associated core domain-containing protein, partial [Fermentimonas sp.]|nr:RHS repeat-associated core domain-containing protein [Fermentimonas sp.]